MTGGAGPTESPRSVSLQLFIRNRNKRGRFIGALIEFDAGGRLRSLGIVTISQPCHPAVPTNRHPAIEEQRTCEGFQPAKGVGKKAVQLPCPSIFHPVPRGTIQRGAHASERKAGNYDIRQEFGLMFFQFPEKHLVIARDLERFIKSAVNLEKTFVVKGCLVRQA
jgi:hypothetical protein